MTALLRYLAPLNHSAREIREEGPSLDPDWLKRVLNPPPPSEHAKRNAAQLAVLDEWERESLHGR